MKVPENVTRKKTCKRCKMVYEGKDVDIAFLVDPQKFANLGSRKYLRPVCRLCKQDKRTEVKHKNRWGPKVNKTRLNHSKEDALDIPVEILINSYGWESNIMIHDGAHAYSNGCTECHIPYKEMEHGLRDITLDIWDPSVEPFYGSNVRWICSSCNSAKGDMPPADWAAYKRLWRQRAAHLAEQSMILKPEQLGFAGWKLNA